MALERRVDLDQVMGRQGGAGDERKDKEQGRHFHGVFPQGGKSYRVAPPLRGD
jgi:hypothetical protein